MLDISSKPEFIVEDLKPCPFCGHTDIIISDTWYESWGWRWGAHCNWCTTEHATKTAAIEYWNTRVECLYCFDASINTRDGTTND